MTSSLDIKMFEIFGAYDKSIFKHLWWAIIWGQQQQSRLRYIAGINLRLKLLAVFIWATGLGFVELFPVQTAVWQETGGGLSTAHDMCIAAPTGSGKTLAYVLPVLNCLARQERRWFLGTYLCTWAFASPVLLRIERQGMQRLAGR
jgi:hypothetical protein